MYAAVVVTDRFAVCGSTAQPANSSVKSATTVRLTVLPFSIVFFIPEPNRCKLIHAIARVRDFSVSLSK